MINAEFYKEEIMESLNRGEYFALVNGRDCFRHME